MKLYPVVVVKGKKECKDLQRRARREGVRGMSWKALPAMLVD